MKPIVCGSSLLPTLSTLVVLLGLAPLAVEAAQSGDFMYSSDGSAITITGYTGYGGAVIVPGTIAGLPVTRIGEAAFRNCSELTSVAMPAAVVSIEGAAFQNWCARQISSLRRQGPGNHWWPRGR